MDLFRLISRNINRDITCYAFGGNAMMFYGYKDDTKDVDIVFALDAERKEFMRCLYDLGYRESSAVTVYVPEKLRDKSKPVVMKTEDGRFDLFVKKVFQTILSPAMQKEVYSVHEFQGKGKLAVQVLRKEFIVLLKSVTSREKDFEDIVTIMKKEKDFNWQFLLEEVKWQFSHGDGWVLLDVEKMMQELKEYVFIPEKWFKELYAIGKG